MKKIKYALILPLICFCIAATAQSYTKTAYGIKTSVNAIDIEIQFFSPKIVRIIKSPAGINDVKNSLSVIQSPQKQELIIHADGAAITVSSKAIQVKVNKLNGQVTFNDIKGSSLLSEKPEGIKFVPVKDSLENTFTVTQVFQLKQGEAIYGLGQHQEGAMDQRNQRITLKQDNRQVAVPFMHSSKGYGLFWDNYSTTVFDDKESEASFSSQIGNSADYYFIYGGNADGVIAGLRYLTGQAPMFPRWVFGYWQSRERYKSQQQAVGVVKKYRELKVPFDGLVQDWQYWGVDDTQWNSTEFGNPNYPNPKAMIDSVHLLNAHIIISVWPSFGNKTKIWADMNKNGFLYHFSTWPINPAVQPYDAFNPRARDLWWHYTNKNIFSLGMDGWWLDSTEPDHMNARESDDNTPTYLGTFRKVRNAYPLVHTGGVYQHQRATGSDKRVFILARSAFAGQQRNATTVWSGDIGSDWSILRKQISGGLNLSLSGIPYWNTDIGGFFSGGYYRNGIDPAFKELYVRWLQFATFCPMMRSHGTDVPREIYQFGEKGTWAYGAIEKYINLRYRLLPYNYSNAWGITANASTMMRALVMDFPEDPKALNINNEYMFGKAILVCPVTDSMYTSKVSSKTDFDNVKSQSVYLPANHTWFDFWTGDQIKGGQIIKKESPIDVLPLYVKAGSIIPMGPFQQYTSEKSLKNIELRIYPGADGTFTLYEDENDNYNYEKGVYSTIEFKWNDKTKTLTIDSRKRSYPGMIKNRTFNVILVSSNHGTGAGIIQPDKAITYTGLKKVVKF
ncbi:TIM-barrel domain-containing protein [Mucilaginibacter sp.]|uniref:glycoside hydrolase family 31 protein n=1 Tax=Mucilaginibacter sp. TaxID=1882438 RepID=UPI00284BB52F|nr:TIM-barrel domain-containing protein [Mucilaginibacter sp.]MDR3693875.1 glycoside hydrolase family 31 protein [Mucilaginibacter sp.]